MAAPASKRSSFFADILLTPMALQVGRAGQCACLAQACKRGQEQMRRTVHLESLQQ